MTRTAFAIFLLLSACGSNNDTNNEENSLNAFANNFDACGDSESCADGEECVEYANGEQCVPAERPARLILDDTSTGCVDTDPRPGVSLISVEVKRRDGSLLGRGRVLSDVAGSPIAADRGLEPDGSQVTADACDDGFNLGCGGSVVIEIVDELGEPLSLRAGQELAVQIRADADCGDGPGGDSFAVVACDDPEGALDGDRSSCASWPLDESAPGAYTGELLSWDTK